MLLEIFWIADVCVTEENRKLPNIVCKQQVMFVGKDSTM